MVLRKMKSSLFSALSVSCAQADMRAEIDRLGREKKDMAERIREVENQLEWVRSEREEESAKLHNEKKGLQDRLRDTESQLAQLKSRKRDELKVITHVIHSLSHPFQRFTLLTSYKFAESDEGEKRISREVENRRVC